MDLSPVLKVIGPIVEPLLEQSIESYWPQVQAEIASVENEDVRLILEALAPALKGLLIAELRAHLLKGK